MRGICAGRVREDDGTDRRCWRGTVTYAALVGLSDGSVLLGDGAHDTLALVCVGRHDVVW